MADGSRKLPGQQILLNLSQCLARDLRRLQYVFSTILAKLIPPRHQVERLNRLCQYTFDLGIQWQARDARQLLRYWMRVPHPLAYLFRSFVTVSLRIAAHSATHACNLCERPYYFSYISPIFRQNRNNRRLGLLWLFRTLWHWWFWLCDLLRL